MPSSRPGRKKENKVLEGNEKNEPPRAWSPSSCAQQAGRFRKQMGSHPADLATRVHGPRLDKKVREGNAEARKVPQLAKVLATKADDLSSSPRTLVVGGEY